MSVDLTPINDPDGDSVSFSNSTWEILTQRAAAQVKPWNGLHDRMTYTPEELRAIAAVIPEEWPNFGWAAGLERLAQSGGAELS